MGKTVEGALQSWPNKNGTRSLILKEKSKVIHSSFIFNGKDVSHSESQKLLRLVLDSKLNFDMNLKRTFSIINNSIPLLRKLRHFIPSKPLHQ